MEMQAEALEQRMDRRFDAVYGRIDALVQPQVKLVNR